MMRVVVVVGDGDDTEGGGCGVDVAKCDCAVRV